MLARQFLHLAENFGAPTRIATLALTKFHFIVSLLPACYQATHEHNAGNIIANPIGIEHDAGWRDDRISGPFMNHLGHGPRINVVGLRIGLARLVPGIPCALFIRS
jgi:hypothetical protein